MIQTGDADQDGNHYFGHKIGPRPSFDTPLIPGDAEFRGDLFMMVSRPSEANLQSGSPNTVVE